MVSKVHSALEGSVRHISEVLWQADHLGTLLSAVLDQPRASFEILFCVLRGTELNDANNAFEGVLLRRERMLIVCDPI